MSCSNSQVPVLTAIHRSNRIALSVLVASAGMTAQAHAQSDRYQVTRTVEAATAGVSGVRLSSGSGKLVVTGHAGSSELRVTAIVHGPSQAQVNAVKIAINQSGGVLTVREEKPDRSWFESDNTWVDLTVEVPTNIALDVSDGSGGTRIDNVGAVRLRSGSGGARLSNVAGGVDVRSGSGGVELRNVTGNVTASSGSGGVTIDGVNGSVDIRDAGSGSLHIRGVTGSVHLGSIGSGSLVADNVGGDLTVDSKGSGSVQFTNVKGRVSVPDRGRDR
jgi:hypothetical protein